MRDLRNSTESGTATPRGRRRRVDTLLPNLVRVYESLQVSGGATARELVDELGMSRSTVYRYLDQYLPAWLGPDGLIKDGDRYCLDNSPFRFIRLDAADQQALAIASRILGIIGMPFQREFDHIFFRLCHHNRDQSIRTRDAISARLDDLLAFAEPHVCRPLADPDLVSQLFRYCQQRPRTPIRFDYASATTPEQKERKVWPVGLIFNNAWFLLGYDPAKVPHFRLYAVDRLQRVRESLADGPDPVGDYGVSDHLQHAWRLIAGNGVPQLVELWMPARLAAEAKHHSQTILSREGDRALVRFEVGDPLEMTRFVMAHADEVDVVAPESLRDEVTRRLRRALDRR